MLRGLFMLKISMHIPIKKIANSRKNKMVKNKMIGLVGTIT